MTKEWLWLLLAVIALPLVLAITLACVAWRLAVAFEEYLVG